MGDLRQRREVEGQRSLEVRAVRGRNCVQPEVEDAVEPERDEVKRQDPEAAPQEKCATVESSAQVLLTQRQRRDQEAAEDEENGHPVPPSEPCPAPVAARVDEDYEQHGDCANSVERREVALCAVLLVGERSHSRVLSARVRVAQAPVSPLRRTSTSA